MFIFFMLDSGESEKDQRSLFYEPPSTMQFVLQILRKLSFYNFMYKTSKLAAYNLLSYGRPAGSPPLMVGHQAVRKTFLPHRDFAYA